MVCCDDIIQNIRANSVLTRNEAHFLHFGWVNNQKFRYWAENNPTASWKVATHRTNDCVVCSCDIWCIYCVLTFWVGRPLGYSNIWPVLEDAADNLALKLWEQWRPDVWLQQDGATAPTARSVETERVFQDIWFPNTVTLDGLHTRPAPSYLLSILPPLHLAPGPAIIFSGFTLKLRITNIDHWKIKEYYSLKCGRNTARN